MTVLFIIAAVFFGGPCVAVLFCVTAMWWWLIVLDPIVARYRDWRFRRYCRRVMPREEAEAFIRENCP